jgi:hypothetical protein
MGGGDYLRHKVHAKDPKVTESFHAPVQRRLFISAPVQTSDL